ncbi:hypothetical protein JHK86_006632 [Glycine max]|nr:hypothetical protein JHK86_006632 [Glycine max]
MLMMKVVAEVANASKKRRKLNSIHEEGIHAEGVQQKMNDLVYVMYNSKLESKKNRKTIALPLDEIEFDDEWITEKGYNDEDEQPRGEGDGGNVELVGDVRGSSNDLVVDAFDLDNLILVEPYDDAQSEEDLDDDGEGDESADIHGDDPIRGLDMEEAAAQEPTSPVPVSPAPVIDDSQPSAPASKPEQPIVQDPPTAPELDLNEHAKDHPQED